MKIDSAILGMALALGVVAQCFGQAHQSFAVRAVDETASTRQTDPPDEDFVPAAETNTYLDHGLWLKRDGQIGRDGLADAYVCIEARTGMPVVHATLTPEGARAFGALTSQNVGRQIAIVVNGKIVSAPVIREPILGGEMEISGALTLEDAEALASQILGEDLAGGRPEPKTCPSYVPNYRRVGRLRWDAVKRV